MSEFRRTGITNLVRHRSGNYYLQAKIGGKKVRRSLRTKDKEVARYRLPDALEAERCRQRGLVSMRSTGRIEAGSWGDAVRRWSEKQNSRPELKDRTRDYYEYLGEVLEEVFPPSLEVSKLSVEMVASWWSEEAASGRSSQLANNLLSACREMMRDAIREGFRRDDPFQVLGRRKLERRVLEVPSLEEMEQVLASIGEVNGGRNLESLDMIEFLAFTGLRIGEARAVTWADVGRDFLTVTGGAAGTKNREFRRVPMMPRVVELLNRRRGEEKPVGPVFRVKSPKNALSNACERVGIPHLRIHDLRHFFATHCIEQGVDVPTVAKWLGHKDGGVLAMKTYGHVRDDHSLAMIKKLG